MIDKDPIEIRKLDKKFKKSLGLFFEELVTSKDQDYFHPHPFTFEEATRIVEYEGYDLYFAMIKGSEIIGYGMLRGWDEGYSIPSLGIIIKQNMRGKGLGKLFMHYLHIVAHLRGAKSVRLKVYPDNLIAKNLYEGIGYTFETLEDGQLVGYIKL